MQRIDPMGFCAPWDDYFINNQNNYQNIDNKTNMTLFWKALDLSLNNCAGLAQWAVVSLGPTLTYTISNLNILRNFLEANQCIDCDRWIHKNRHLRHNLPQA